MYDMRHSAHALGDSSQFPTEWGRRPLALLYATTALLYATTALLYAHYAHKHPQTLTNIFLPSYIHCVPGLAKRAERR
jgi:hypothetical protein